ncbi:MAG: ATP synthase F0F1 subunit epsilon [Betaproteobacteria bacterium SG8_40]|jgi:F-type H+-transporting ATPase subunit epsilon|nr:MAG: ATP synthase F0F1 subunit epsilon [Betaproteobacteria bacterium SG8_40]
MKTFTLQLQDATQSEEIAGVTSFSGEDASGSFGILAGHARMMTSLIVGLARFRVGEEHWRYLALPGAVLYFHDDKLTLSTRRYLLDDDHMRISQALQQQLLAEEDALKTIKHSLRQMEQEALKRLWEMGRRSAA